MNFLRQFPASSLLSKLVLAAIAVIFTAGCVSSDDLEGPQPDTGRRELPWNTQQGWESTGVLGGYADRIGTR